MPAEEGVHGKPLPIPTVLWLLPLIGSFCLIVAATRSGADTQNNLFKNWLKSSEVTNPIKYAQAFSDGEDLVYELSRGADVRSATDGEVIEVLRDSVTILEARHGYDPMMNINNPPHYITYFGLRSKNVSLKQQVQRGDTIGRIEVGNPDPLRARLRLRVIPKTTSERVAPVGFSYLYGHSPADQYQAGKGVYLQYCYSCHEKTGSLFKGGKMRNQEPATVEVIKKKVRLDPTTSLDPNEGMPRFNKATLDDAKLDQVALYLSELAKQQ